MSCGGGDFYSCVAQWEGIGSGKASFRRRVEPAGEDTAGTEHDMAHIRCKTSRRWY
jgi:hypothetical protein